VFQAFLDFEHAALFVSLLHDIYTAANNEVKITGNAPRKAIGYAQISFGLFGVALDLFSRI
jgi:hypothetical protein